MTTTTPTTTPNTTKSNIVCVCPYCRTGYEWWVNCDCLDEEASEAEASEAEEASEEEASEEEASEEDEEADEEEADEASESEEDEAAEVYDLITCEYCGDQWDGFAQCKCWGYMNCQDEQVVPETTTALETE